MSIYPDLKLIFVHVPKTAGGALRLRLEPYAANPPETLWNELLRHLPVHQRPDRVRLGLHEPASWIRRKIGNRLWEEWTSFAVIRNPFTRAISYYEYIRQTDSHHRQAVVAKQDFEDFLARARDHHFRQVDKVADRNGRVLVDHLVKLENLRSGLQRVSEAIGFDLDPGPSRGVNSSKKRPREEYLSPRAIDLIRRRSAEDFRVLGYSDDPADI